MSLTGLGDGYEMALFFQCALPSFYRKKNTTNLNRAVSSLSLIVTSLPRIRRLLDVSDGGLLMNPRITENEIALSTHVDTSGSSSGGETLKSTQSNPAKSTLPVTSERQKRVVSQEEWLGFASMGSTHDKRTSSPSILDHYDVTLHQHMQVRPQDVIHAV